MASVQDLIDFDDPGWPIVEEWINEANSDTTRVTVLPAGSSLERGMALSKVQVTTRSILGTIIYETGGLLISHGWLRILGSGSTSFQLPSVPDLSARLGLLDVSPPKTKRIVIGVDVLGGLFALTNDTQTVHYFAPDLLQWEDLELGYSDFLQWAMSPRLDRFYLSERWNDWQNDVRALNGSQGIHIFPPLFTEKDLPVEQRSRKVIPIHELLSQATLLAGSDPF